MNWLQEPVDPMLAKLISAIPEGDYIYEIKWDGIRAIITLQDGNIRITSRNKKDITGQFPELKKTNAFKAENGIFDAEIVALDNTSRPSFQQIIHRLKITGEKRIERVSQSNPAQCYVFDCLYLNGKQLTDRPLEERYQMLKDTMKSTGRYVLNDIFENGNELYSTIKEHDMEGIMAKKKGSRYLTGKRSDNWLKVKIRHESTCFIIGYTKGMGDPATHFGALHLAEDQEKDLVYRGKVGTGFSQAKLERIFAELNGLDEVKPPDYAPDEKGTKWVVPKLKVVVTYSEITSDGVYQDPVFIKLISR